MPSTARKFTFGLTLLLAAGLVWAVWLRLQESKDTASERKRTQSVPVEVASVKQGTITLRRTFSGTLESPAEFVVAPKVSGRVRSLAVDLGDTVDRGQVVARLDNEEFIQARAQAEADLAVARAKQSEARSALSIAERELKRIETLRQRGVASESQLDTARSTQLAARARLEVAKAEVLKALASLETTRIRLGYASVTADWTVGDQVRHVAERYVDAGQTVSVGTPLLKIVELNPLTGVIFVTEKDYAKFQTGQLATLSNDAFPGSIFTAHVSRIAPVFTEDTRQARVELSIDNADQRLKPGMFIRVTLALERVEKAVIVPSSALTLRNDRAGLFVLNEAGQTVFWQEVRLGIQEKGRVQILSPKLRGRVVTLGQQMLDDGSQVSIPGKLESQKADESS